MSFQNLLSRRPPAKQLTHRSQMKELQKSKPQPQQSQSYTSKNTRRRRIRDLLRHIPTFIIRFLRLLTFVAFLLPAFIVFLWHYVTCARIAAYYGNAFTKDRSHSNDKDPFFSRHYLDIYGSRTLPQQQSSVVVDQNGKKKPVIIFLTGGAWIIGYRMWGNLLARALVPFGILVVMPDYRNFPRVNIDGMVQDCDMSIQWVLDNIEHYGGDPEKIVLVGQSAGAHIGGTLVAMKVLDWLRKERAQQEGQPMLKSTYSPNELCGFISTSSPHNLVSMRPVFHHHGLSASVQRSIFGGEGEEADDDVFEKWSPYHLVMKSKVEYDQLMQMEDGKYSDDLGLKDIFPRLCVIHGSADSTVPVKEAIEFISLLTKLNIPTEAKIYPNWTHTDPILEAPMRGNHLYHRDVYSLVCKWTNHTSIFNEKHPMLHPICPSVLVEGARFCNPF